MRDIGHAFEARKVISPKLGKQGQGSATQEPKERLEFREVYKLILNKFDVLETDRLLRKLPVQDE